MRELLGIGEPAPQTSCAGTCNNVCEVQCAGTDSGCRREGRLCNHAS
jgi:hypothetical protein